MGTVSVLFQLGLPGPLTYECGGLDLEPGQLVRAPLGPRERTGLVVAPGEAGAAEKPEASEESSQATRELKAVSEALPFAPLSDDFRAFLWWSARFCAAPPHRFLRMALSGGEPERPERRKTGLRLADPLPEHRATAARSRVLEAAARTPGLPRAALAEAAQTGPGVVKGLEDLGALLAVPAAPDAPPEGEGEGGGEPGPELTGEQRAAAALVWEAERPVLLDGVTGSGKTEVYFDAIARTLAADPAAQVLVLLPEIALTQAILARFAARFGMPPDTWHSAMTPAQRRKTWRRAARGRSRILIGARSALFVPLPGLRLVIVDEEHDSSFKQEEPPTYHARNLAVVRAAKAGARLILGSATPSLESHQNAIAGRYRRAVLSARPGSARLPEVELVDLRQHPPERGAHLSPPLRTALGQAMERGEQALLFINRRGYAPLVICKSCGERMMSPGTDATLTWHRSTNRLVCHLTGYSAPRPSACPACGEKGALSGLGPGVERVAAEARSLFPGRRVDVLSSDTAATPAALQAAITRMEEGGTDILVGTQIVAKGHNFPSLTLVGVMDGDHAMTGSDPRAGERTYQLLAQVAGRAGRAERPGRALIQTHQPAAPALQALARGDRDAFLRAELDARRSVGMPPFGRLAALVLSAPDAARAGEAARRAALAAPNGRGIDVFGPAEAPVSVLRGRWRWRFLVKGGPDADLPAYMSAWLEALDLPRDVRIKADVDPYSFM